MKTTITTLAVAALAAGTQAFAGTNTWFTPLTESAPVTEANSLEEVTQPWVSPAGISQVNIVNMRQVEDTVLGADESIVRVPGLGNVASMFDMIAYDPSGNYLFIPHETLNGAGVSRHDIAARKTEILFQGDQTGVRNQDSGWEDDWGAFDPCRFTPNGTLFLAEEWSGEGRVIEVMNPFATPGEIEIRELHSIANVAHEGINFSEKSQKVIYYVDENRSGSIYKFVMSTKGDYTEGQTFVLVVDEFAGDPAQNYNAEINLEEPRTGAAKWVAITDKEGNYTTQNDPFAVTFSEGSRILGGALAADEVNGTPYGRPEDCEVARLKNGNEVLYFAATSEATVYSVEMIGSKKAFVRVFASEAATTKNKGFAPTTGILNSPDNLAQDALGNIYIIEDAPNSSSTGGDIWFCRDRNNDGVAESIDHFLSIRAAGSEATGMIFNPAIPTEFVIAVQHPQSTDLETVADGHGDAVWMFDVSNIDNQKFVKQLVKTTLPKGKKK